MADGLHQFGVILRLEARVKRFLDVADVVPVAEILVDETVDIAQLQLDGGAHVVEAHDLGIIADNLQAPLQVAQVVISHFEYE